MTKYPILVSVEIKPYLVDYFKHHYGGHPIKVNSRSKLLPFIHDHLSRPPVKYRPLKNENKILTFQLPWNKIIDIRKLNYISPRKHKLFNTYFYNKFHHHFTTYMNEACNENNCSYKTAIENFMLENCISFDRFQYDSLKRLYLRYRQTYKKNGKNIL